MGRSPSTQILSMSSIISMLGPVTWTRDWYETSLIVQGAARAADTPRSKRWRGNLRPYMSCIFIRFTIQRWVGRWFNFWRNISRRLCLRQRGSCVGKRLLFKRKRTGNLRELYAFVRRRKWKFLRRFNRVASPCASYPLARWISDNSWTRADAKGTTSMTSIARKIDLLVRGMLSARIGVLIQYL